MIDRELGERAPVVEEPKRIGEGTRLRCTVCNKVAKATRLEAERSVARIYLDRRYMMVAYYSKKCGWWHLATAKKKR